MTKLQINRKERRAQKQMKRLKSQWIFDKGREIIQWEKGEPF